MQIDSITRIHIDLTRAADSDDDGFSDSVRALLVQSPKAVLSVAVACLPAFVLDRWLLPSVSALVGSGWQISGAELCRADAANGLKSLPSSLSELLSGLALEAQPVQELSCWPEDRFDDDNIQQNSSAIPSTPQR